ncbi:hypothetical protein GCM10028774_52580 [Spirosoma jeollabukense]
MKTRKEITPDVGLLLVSLMVTKKSRGIPVDAELKFRSFIRTVGDKLGVVAFFDEKATPSVFTIRFPLDTKVTFSEDSQEV